MCNKRCRIPIKTNIICTAFGVPYRIIRTIRCSNFMNHFFWFLTKGIKWLTLLQVSLKCMSLKVVLDLLNKVLNVDAMRSFHCRIRHSWNIEVNVLLVDCTVELCPRWMMQCHDVLQEQIVLSLCVCLSCLAPHVPLFHREHAQHGCLQTFSQLSPIYLKNQVLCANVFHRSRVNGTFFLYPQKTRSVSSSFPDRSQIGLGFGWVGLESLTRGASPKNFARISLLAVVQLWNPIDHSLQPNRDVTRSLVVVDVTCMLSYVKLIQSSIWQLWEYNKLEVFLEKWLHSIVSDRMSILLNSKININPEYRVLMPLPCIMQILCSTWYREVKSVQNLDVLCLWDH